MWKNSSLSLNSLKYLNLKIRNKWNKSQVKLILDQLNRIGAIVIKSSVCATQADAQ